MAQSEQRQHQRYPFDARVSLNARDSTGKVSEYWGRAFEIGEQGLRATIVGDLNLNDVVTLKIPLHSGEELEVRASVCYKSGFQCGFEFLFMNAAQQDLLKRTCVVLSVGRGSV